MEIQNFFAYRIVIQRIAGKVSAHRIFFYAAISVVFHNPAVRVLLHLAAAAECRYFYGFRTCHDMDDLKTPADDAAAAENFSHLLRRSIGGDIEVLGSTPNSISLTAPPTI